MARPYSDSGALPQRFILSKPIGIEKPVPLPKEAVEPPPQRAEEGKTDGGALSLTFFPPLPHAFDAVIDVIPYDLDRALHEALFKPQDRVAILQYEAKIASFLLEERCACDPIRLALNILFVVI